MADLQLGRAIEHEMQRLEKENNGSARTRVGSVVLAIKSEKVDHSVLKQEVTSLFKSEYGRTVFVENGIEAPSKAVGAGNLVVHAPDAPDTARTRPVQTLQQGMKDAVVGQQQKPTGPRLGQ